MIVPVALLGSLIAGLAYGRGPFFLGLAFSVLLLAIVVFWQSLLSLTGDAPLTLDEALSLAAPSAEEERKVSILRTLKDLEYERSVGKISEDDYRELSQKYRSEARALLQVLDEKMTARREQIEQQVKARLAAAGTAPQTVRSATHASDNPAASSAETSATEPKTPSASASSES